MHNIKVIMGEKKNEAMRSSFRTYLFYVTPTGVELSISKCPHMKRVWYVDSSASAIGERSNEAEWQVTEPVMLKLVAFKTILGKPKKWRNIFILVNEDGPLIKLSGYNGFGGFNGRGYIQYEKSGITLKEAEKDFAYAMIEQPKEIQSTNVRSLIFLKRGGNQ